MTLSSPVETAYRNLRTQMLEYLRTPIEERVNLYVAKFSGGKPLSEYVANAEVKDEDKLRVMGALSAIISSGDWSRLPEIDPIRGGPNVAAEEDRLANGEAHEHVDEDPMAQMKAIARKEARAELADVLEKVAKVLRETL